MANILSSRSTSPERFTERAQSVRAAALAAGAMAFAVLVSAPVDAQQSLDDEAESAPLTAEQCSPACRDGFVCEEAVCISACNPPCAADSICTGTTNPSCQLLPDPELETRSAAQRAEDEKIRKHGQAYQQDQQRLREQRQQERQARANSKKYVPTPYRPPEYSPQFIVGLRLGFQSAAHYYYDDYQSGGQAGLMAGVHWNFNARMGVEGVVEALVGSWFQGRDLAPNGNVRSIRLRATPYFRPHPWFQIGPSVAIGRNSYSLEFDRFDEEFDGSSHGLFGYGVQLGWRLPGPPDLHLGAGLMFLHESIASTDPLPFEGDAVEWFGSLAFGF